MTHPFYLGDVLRTAQIVACCTQQHNGIASTHKRNAHAMFRLFDDSHHTNGWRRVHGLTVCALIIKTHVSTGHRRIKLSTSLTHSFNGVFELIINLLVVRIAEIQTVGNGRWHTTTATNVPSRLSHRNLRTLIGISKNVSAVAIHGQCQTLF